MYSYALNGSLSYDCTLTFSSFCGCLLDRPMTNCLLNSRVGLLLWVIGLNPVAEDVPAVCDDAFVTAVLILPVGIDDRRVLTSVPDTLLGSDVLLRRAAGQRRGNLVGAHVTTRLLLLLHRMTRMLRVLLSLLLTVWHLLIHVVWLRWCHAHVHHSVHVCIGKVVLLHLLLLLLLRRHSHLLLLLLDHHLLLLLGGCCHRIHLHVVGWRLRLSLARMHRWLTVMLKMRLHLHHGQLWFNALR